MNREQCIIEEITKFGFEICDCCSEAVNEIRASRLRHLIKIKNNKKCTLTVGGIGISTPTNYDSEHYTKLSCRFYEGDGVSFTSLDVNLHTNMGKFLPRFYYKAKSRTTIVIFDGSFFFNFDWELILEQLEFMDLIFCSCKSCENCGKEMLYAEAPSLCWACEHGI